MIVSSHRNKIIIHICMRLNNMLQPEGVTQQYSTSLFINLSPGQSYQEVLSVSLPTVGLVAGSQYIEVTVIG
jgi:hypothetical protein